MTLTSLQLTPRPAEPAIPRDLIDKPTITIGNETFDIDAGDLESLCVLGRGAYGVVEKMKLRQTGTILAVKVNKIFPRIHWDGVPWRIYWHQLLNFSIMHAYRQGIIKAYRVKMSNLGKPSVFRAFGTRTSDVKFNESGSETLLHASCPFNESLHVSILLLQSMDEFKSLQFCFYSWIQKLSFLKLHI